MSFSFGIICFSCYSIIIMLIKMNRKFHLREKKDFILDNIKTIVYYLQVEISLLNLVKIIDKIIARNFNLLLLQLICLAALKQWFSQIFLTKLIFNCFQYCKRNCFECSIVIDRDDNFLRNEITFKYTEGNFFNFLKNLENLICLERFN